MGTTAEILNALVDLRAIARGNGMQVQTGVVRLERRAPVRVRIAVMSRGGGLVVFLKRGEDAVAVIHAMIRNLENANITSRRYESDP